MLPGKGRLSGWGFSSGRGGACVVSGIGIKRKFLGEGLPERGDYSGDISPQRAYKFEVSSFSRLGDTRGSQN